MVTTTADKAATAPAYADVVAAIDRGVDYLTSIQRDAGCVVGEVVWCPMLTAQYVMVAHITGQAIDPARKARFVKYFEVWQLPDGGFGMHAESPGYVFVTTLVYIALRLMGFAPEHPMCARALAWLRANGGVLPIPTWGKAWLAIMNLSAWEAVPPVLPELWLQPDASPFHPRRMYCHTRMIYLGMGYLYGVKFTTPVSPIIEALRRELYDQPYESIDFPAHRYDIAATDVFEPPSALLKGLYETCAAYERVAPALLRRRALDECLTRIVHHQRESRYAAISPVNGLMNTLALWHAGHPDFLPSFRGVDYWVWTDEAEGERFNGAHSHTWDTAFTVQAIAEGPRAAAHQGFLGKAARYLKNAQMREEVRDRERFYRDQRRGGWCFSDEHHRWPVSDCTAEAVSALRYLANLVPMDDLPEPELLAEAMRFLLTRQNEDGGWGSYERQRGGHLLKLFNPSEMFGNCMIEYSYVECTASCLQALRHGLDRFGQYLSARDRRRVTTSIARGAAFLRKTQTAEGGWAGFWGVNYTYGTLFGVTGLLAAGAPQDDPAIRRACEWLVSVRLADGGWGESYRGCVEERYIASEKSQAIMTSWALMTLLRAGYTGPGARDAVEDGARLLLERQGADGAWPKEGVGGVFFNTAMHHYCLYKDYFSVWALGLYARTLG